MKRYVLSLVLLGLFVAAVAGCQGGESTGPTDPAAVMDAYTAAINAHDVEAALALVDDNAVYDRSVGAFQGKEEIRGFIEGLIARNVSVELIGERQVDGERVSWTSRVRLDDPDNPGGPQLEAINDSESVVRGGKIVSHTARRQE